MERMTAADLRASQKKAKRQDVEGPIHVAILEYLAFALPRAEVHHSPNELNMAGDKKPKAIAQARAKRMGMRPGWPDIEFVLGGRVYFLEVKAPGGTQSEDQEAVELALTKAGAPYATVRSVNETTIALKEWGLI